MDLLVKRNKLEEELREIRTKLQELENIKKQLEARGNQIVGQLQLINELMESDTDESGKQDEKTADKE